MIDMNIHIRTTMQKCPTERVVVLCGIFYKIQCIPAQTGNPPLHNLSPNTTGEDSMAKISTHIWSPLGRDPKIEQYIQVSVLCYIRNIGRIKRLFL
jgi:hypothetical protein